MMELINGIRYQFKKINCFRFGIRDRFRRFLSLISRMTAVFAGRRHGGRISLLVILAFIFTLAPLRFLSNACVFNCRAAFMVSAFAARIEVSTIITANSGTSSEDFYIKTPSEPSHSLYFANGAPAFFVSGGAERFIYILDAANSRVKKYNLSGDFNSLIKLSSDFGINHEGLCGIYVSEAQQMIVHTEKELYFVKADGKITGRASLTGGTECHKIFSADSKSLTAYDYKNLRIYRAAFDLSKKEAAITLSFDNIVFPWPVSGGGFICPSLLTPRDLLVYKYNFASDALFPAAGIKLPSGEFVSQFKFIGRDRKNNYYLRYFGDITQKIAVIDENLKLIDEITMETAYSSKRSNLLYDECVDDDGNIYTLFIDSDKLIVKKITKSE